METYFVYILASYGRSRVLYIGVTRDLQRRMNEHAHRAGSQFVRRYGVTRLVYFETYADPISAIAREKQLKGWVRAKKIALIEAKNPEWRDLASSG